MWEHVAGRNSPCAIKLMCSARPCGRISGPAFSRLQRAAEGEKRGLTPPQR